MEKLTKEEYRSYLEELLENVRKTDPISEDGCYRQIELTNYAMKELYLLDNEK